MGPNGHSGKRKNANTKKQFKEWGKQVQRTATWDARRANNWAVSALGATQQRKGIGTAQPLKK